MVSAQPNQAANDYMIQTTGTTQLKQPVLFSAFDADEQKRLLYAKFSIVIGVVSAPNHFAQREAIRSTWGQVISLEDVLLDKLNVTQKESILVKFIIGRVPESDWALQKKLKEEAKKYNDIVRVNVQEDYFQLTYKTGEFLKWAVANVNFQWAMKCDDDSFVRLDKLLADLSTRGSTRLYMGKMWTGTPVDRRIDSYSSDPKYATFAAGAGYVLSYDLALYIAQEFDILHKWPMEDVSVGMWLEPLQVNYVDHPNFHSMPEGCDKAMIVQNPAEPMLMKTTFFNTVNGVPCNQKPDPWDPSTKNIPDHVLLQLGIPKAKEGEAAVSKDAMQQIEGQMLIQSDDMPSVADEDVQVQAGMTFADMMNRKPDPNFVM